MHSDLAVGHRVCTRPQAALGHRLGQYICHLPFGIEWIPRSSPSYLALRVDLFIHFHEDGI